MTPMEEKHLRVDIDEDQQPDFEDNHVKFIPMSQESHENLSETPFLAIESTTKEDRNNTEGSFLVIESTTKEDRDNTAGRNNSVDKYSSIVIPVSEFRKSSIIVPVSVFRTSSIKVPVSEFQNQSQQDEFNFPKITVVPNFLEINLSKLQRTETLLKFRKSVDFKTPVPVTQRQSSEPDFQFLQITIFPKDKKKLRKSTRQSISKTGRKLNMLEECEPTKSDIFEFDWNAFKKIKRGKICFFFFFIFTLF